MAELFRLVNYYNLPGLTGWMVLFNGVKNAWCLSWDLMMGLMGVIMAFNLWCLMGFSGVEWC